MPESLKLNYGGAVNMALARVLRDVPETILYGEDVGKPGGVFGVTRGLRRAFGDRVFDTPISESAILGSALGAAMFGRRPIVEIMWIDFALVAMDQIVNQIANARYVSRGMVSAPLVIRTQQGRAPGSCAQHSQSLEAFFLHVPGVRVAMPTTPQDAYDMLIAAVYSNDPVLVIENRNLYAGAKVAVEIDRPVSPIGGSFRRRSGEAATVISWGSITRDVEAAVDRLALPGGVDVIELGWLNPFDVDTVLESVSRTHRVAVVHEANRTGGFGAEILARIAEAGISLHVPAHRVAVDDVRMPSAPSLAEFLIPNIDDIAEAVKDLVER